MEEWEMSKRKWISLAVAALLGGTATVQAQGLSGGTETPVRTRVLFRSSDGVVAPAASAGQTITRGTAVRVVQAEPQVPGAPGKGEPGPGQPEGQAAPAAP